MGKEKSMIKSVLFPAVLSAALACVLLLQWDQRRLLSQHLDEHAAELAPRAQCVGAGPCITSLSIKHFDASPELQELERYRQQLLKRSQSRPTILHGGLGEGLDKSLGEIEITFSETRRHYLDDVATDEEGNAAATTAPASNK